jgi:hypothetical protein
VQVLLFCCTAILRRPFGFRKHGLVRFSADYRCLVVGIGPDIDTVNCRCSRLALRLLAGRTILEVAIKQRGTQRRSCATSSQSSHVREVHRTRLITWLTRTHDVAAAARRCYPAAGLGLLRVPRAGCGAASSFAHHLERPKAPARAHALPMLTVAARMW